MLRFHRLLLLTYPASFRSRFGREMALAFEAGWRDACRRGRLAAMCYLAAATVDFIFNGLRERHARRPQLPEQEKDAMLILQDLRFAARTLRRQPGFSLVVILTLGIGIGATTAIFSIIDGVLLRPLPYRDPGRLAFAWTKLAWIGVPRAWIAGPHIPLLEDQTTKFESFVALRTGATQLTGDGVPEQVRAGYTTTNLFDSLGVSPALGRTFRSEEGHEGNADVAILGNALWRRRFGADPGIIGRTIMIGGRPVQVIGVMPAAFRFHVHSSLGNPAEPELWMPGTWKFREMQMGGYSFALLLRIRPGMTIEEAQAEVDVIGARLDKERYNRRGFGWQLVGVKEDLTKKARPALFVLTGAAVMVLLIVCANVASLFLVRASGRAREFAVRTALGAGRGRLLLQLLTESLTLAGIGGVVGFWLAYLGVRSFVASANVGIPRLYDVAVDGRVLLVTLVIAVTTGVAFGLVPGLRCSRPGVSESLKEGARGSGGVRTSHLRGALVVGEIALALMLLLGATLLLRSFAALRGVDPGFDPSGVLTANLSLPAAKYPRGEGLPQFVQLLVESLARLPGARAAGATNAAPLSRATNQMDTRPEGSALDGSLLVDAIQITPGVLQRHGNSGALRAGVYLAGPARRRPDPDRRRDFRPNSLAEPGSDR